MSKEYSSIGLYMVAYLPDAIQKITEKREGYGAGEYLGCGYDGLVCELGPLFMEVGAWLDDLCHQYLRGPGYNVGFDGVFEYEVIEADYLATSIEDHLKDEGRIPTVDELKDMLIDTFYQVEWDHILPSNLKRKPTRYVIVDKDGDTPNSSVFETLEEARAQALEDAERFPEYAPHYVCRLVPEFRTEGRNEPTYEVVATNGWED